jgi:hypothetical protein
MNDKIKIALIIGGAIIIGSILHGGFYTTVNHGDGAYSTVNKFTGSKLACRFDKCIPTKKQKTLW